MPVTDICREHGIGRSTYYKWKSKYWGMDIHELKHLRQLETGSRSLKQMYAELSLDHKIKKDIISKELLSPTHGGRWLTMPLKHIKPVSIGLVENRLNSRPKKG